MAMPGEDTDTTDDCEWNRQVAGALYSLAALTVRRMPRDISLTSVSTLHALERLGPQRLTRLAELQGVTQPSMTALVTRLEYDGLAERLSDPGDRRVVLVALTAAGEHYVVRRRQAGAEALAALIARLPSDEAKNLRAALPSIVSLCSLDSQGANLGTAVQVGSADVAGGCWR